MGWKNFSVTSKNSNQTIYSFTLVLFHAKTRRVLLSPFLGVTTGFTFHLIVDHLRFVAAFSALHQIDDKHILVFPAQYKGRSQALGSHGSYSMT